MHASKRSHSQSPCKGEAHDGSRKRGGCCIIWVAMYIYGLGDVMFTL